MALDGEPPVVEEVPLEPLDQCPELQGFQGYSIRQQSTLVQAFRGLRNIFRKVRMG